MDILYLIQHKNIPEYTKIGYTSDLPNRMKQLQTASPTGVHLVYSIACENAYKLEQHLHVRYSRQRTNLEWFALSREDIVDIIFYVEEKVLDSVS